MPTLLCVPIMVMDVHSALADAQGAKGAGADLVEFRVDGFFSGDLEEGPDAPEGSVRDVLRLVADSALPCIVTCRHSSEGGQYDGDEEARVSMYERVGRASGRGEHPPRYLDFELEQYTRSANIRMKVNLAVAPREDDGGRGLSPSLILSNHDFGGMPKDLSRRIVKMQGEESAAVLKVAFRARSLRDNLELFDLLEHRSKPMIALGMGEFGLMSRVLAPKFGGFLTFASLRETSTTAPGQPTVRELLGKYRFRSIGSATRVYGVVGWPVGHSLSPLVHNGGFEAVGHDGVYVPMPIAASEDAEASYSSFKATVEAMLEHERLDLAGLSVTIPHKENLVRLARERGWERDELSEACGAANTVIVNRGGSAGGVRVMNTDARAAISCLEEACGPLKGTEVGVIGAGGVARAIVFALAMDGARVRVLNRSEGKALALAEACRARTAADVTGLSLEAAASGGIDAGRVGAWVNCTPVGMSGGPDPAGIALPGSILGTCSPTAAVLDTVYNPVRTPLLVAAEKAGLRTIDGVKMFVRQAEAQFLGWTGTKAPASLFERLVREALAAKQDVPER